MDLFNILRRWDDKSGSEVCWKHEPDADTVPHDIRYPNPVSSTSNDAGRYPGGPSSKPDLRRSEAPPPEAHADRPGSERSERSPTPLPMNDDYERTSLDPLTKEQIAFYRERIESGYYTTTEVQQHIVERLIEELVPPQKK